MQPCVQLEAIEEAATSSDKTFTPISAAKVTEKLENFIAEQNDDTLSVQSELSAEVAKITAKIPQLEKEESTEELTEIDLSVSATSDSLLQSDEVKFDISSETSAHLQRQEQTLDSFTVPSATSFFVDPPSGNKNVTFYQPSFHAQRPITDPFSFVQSTSTTDSANFPSNVSTLSGPPIGPPQALNANTNNSQFTNLSGLPIGLPVGPPQALNPTAQSSKFENLSGPPIGPPQALNPSANSSQFANLSGPPIGPPQALNPSKNTSPFAILSGPPIDPPKILNPNANSSQFSNLSGPPIGPLQALDPSANNSQFTNVSGPLIGLPQTFNRSTNSSQSTNLYGPPTGPVQSLNQSENSLQFEPPKSVGSSSDVDLMPQSIWGPHQTQVINFIVFLCV